MVWLPAEAALVIRLRSPARPDELFQTGGETSAPGSPGSSDRRCFRREASMATGAPWAVRGGRLPTSSAAGEAPSVTPAFRQDCRNSLQSVELVQFLKDHSLGNDVAPCTYVHYRRQFTRESLGEGAFQIAAPLDPDSDASECSGDGCVVVVGKCC